MAISLPVRKPLSDRFPSPECFRLIKAFEGWSSKAYQDEDGIWTIGWGFTEGVKPGDVMDISTGEARLVQEVAKKAQLVRDKVHVPLTQGEFDALVSYEYNVRGGLKPSLLACLNGGMTDASDLMEPGSYEAAIPQIVRAHWGDRPWAGSAFPDGTPRKIKTPIRGLYRRRLAEACIFRGLTEWQGVCSENLIKLPVEVYQDQKGAWKARANAEEATDPDWVFERATEEMRFKPPAVDLNKPYPQPTITIIDDVRPNPTPQTPQSAPSSEEDAPGGDDELVLSDPVTLPTDLRVTPEASPDVGEASSVPYPGPGGVSAPPSSEAPPTPASIESSRVGDGEKGAAPVITRPPLTPLPVPKNPMRSTTIWGGLITALAPQLDQIGNILLAKSGQFGPQFLVLGVIMIVLGRIGAVQPLSNSAPIRSPQ